MGIVIDTHKTDHTYSYNPREADNFITDSEGRISLRPGELLETMPLGSLGVIAYINVGNAYKQNPYTTKNMRWEVSFSESRVIFFSPDTDFAFGGVAERQGNVTLGFYDYSELRSLSLGSAREQNGPYVSLVFNIQDSPVSQIPVGVRMTGSPQNLGVFATMLVARLIESYERLNLKLSVDTSGLRQLFEGVSSYDYSLGEQIDFFIGAKENSLCISQNIPNHSGYVS